MPDLHTDDGVHVDPCEVPGLYHGDADLVVLRCQTVGPCSARADGWHFVKIIPALSRNSRSINVISYLGPLTFCLLDFPLISFLISHSGPTLDWLSLLQQITSFQGCHALQSPLQGDLQGGGRAGGSLTVLAVLAVLPLRVPVRLHAGLLTAGEQRLLLLTRISPAKTQRVLHGSDSSRPNNYLVSSEDPWTNHKQSIKTFTQFQWYSFLLKMEETNYLFLFSFSDFM